MLKINHHDLNNKFIIFSKIKIISILSENVRHQILFQKKLFPNLK